MSNKNTKNMVDLFSLPMILLYAVLYGVTMKVADLLDEHGLKLFKGSKIIFGILWGLFGALLVVSDVQIANIVLAIILSFIIRLRIDYRNHAIATVIIIISFLLYSTFEPVPFFVFLIVFLIAGSLKDLIDDYYKRTDWLQKVTESGWHYYIPSLVYAFYTSHWIVFYVFTIHKLSYNIVKHIAAKNGYK